MKLFMHWDMEGVSGLFTREHVWYWLEGVRPHIAEEGGQLLTDDVNSAVGAALVAGADELIVCDTHHGGGNLDVDRLLRDASVTYLPRSVAVEHGERRWMPGLDEKADGLMLMGQHTKAGTAGAFVPHTRTLAWDDVRINGQSVGEIGVATCYAGHWSIPLILVQGDEPACSEAQALMPGVVTAAVKRAVSHELCEGSDAASARKLTAQRVAEAIERARAGRFRPWKPSLPMTVAIRMKAPGAAEAAASRPGVQRVDEYTVQSVVARQRDVLAWIG